MIDVTQREGDVQLESRGVSLSNTSRRVGQYSTCSTDRFSYYRTLCRLFAAGRASPGRHDGYIVTRPVLDYRYCDPHNDQGAGRNLRSRVLVFPIEPVLA